MKKNLFLILLGFGSFIYAQEFPVVKGDYFGQTPPGDSAVIFAPGIISLSDRKESQIAFSSNRNECYFTISVNGLFKIYYTKNINNKWSKQEEVSLSENQNTAFPFLSADGNRIYFTNFYNDWSGIDIWMAERTTGGWSDPLLLPSPINSDKNDLYFTETANNVIYFSSSRPGGFGGGDIWYIRTLSNQSLQAENLGVIVNSSSSDISPCIAPDESFLIFSSDRPGGYGFQDLYICFNKGNNRWTTPVNMERRGAKINIPGRHQLVPSLSPDGKYLFFARHSHDGQTSDIYWVSTKVIDDIKKEVFNSDVTK